MPSVNGQDQSHEKRQKFAPKHVDRIRRPEPGPDEEIVNGMVRKKKPKPIFPKAKRKNYDEWSSTRRKNPLLKFDEESEEEGDE